MIQGLLTSSLNKTKLLRTKIKNPTEANTKNYKYFIKSYNKIKRLAKKIYYTNKFAQNVNDIKRTWEMFRQAMLTKSKQCKHEHVFIIENRETENKSEISNAFNAFFVNIGATIGDAVPQPLNAFTDYLNGNHPNNLFMQPTDQQEILTIVRNLKPSTSTGFDDLSTRITKSAIHEVSIPLAHIFNLSLLFGIVPDNMKIAQIVPIYKSGNKKTLNNYRPISILPAF